MENAFEWMRRRRVFNERLPITNASTIEFANLHCSCKDAPSERTTITEIVLTKDVTCILTEEGTSVALDSASHKELCTLNGSPFCVIRSICFNSWNDTIISVWHSRTFNHGLRISVFDTKRVKNGEAVPVTTALKLQNLVIPYPGFVEFEEPNGRIVTSTPHDQLFRFWDMKTYDVAFSVRNIEFKEIRISKGTVAFFRQPGNNVLPVKLCSILDGEILAECELVLYPNRDLRFLELCGCYLLIKQQGACIRVYDLLEGKDNKMKGTKNFLPRAVTFFMGDEKFEAQKPSKRATCFLAVHDTSMEICCCVGGELISIAKLRAHPPVFPADCLQVVQSKEMLLVYTNCGSSLAENNLLDSQRRTDDVPHVGVSDTMRNFSDPQHSGCQKATGSCVNPVSATTPDVMSGESTEANVTVEVAQFFSSASLAFLPDSFQPCKASSPKCTATDEGRGIAVIDLKTGKEIMFIPLQCDDKINVLVYDPIRKEILAGGSRGLHRLRTKFELITTCPLGTQEIAGSAVKSNETITNNAPSDALGLAHPSFDSGDVIADQNNLLPVPCPRADFRSFRPFPIQEGVCEDPAFLTGQTQIHFSEQVLRSHCDPTKGAGNPYPSVSVPPRLLTTAYKKAQRQKTRSSRVSKYKRSSLDSRFVVSASEVCSSPPCTPSLRSRCPAVLLCPNSGNLPLLYATQSSRSMSTNCSQPTSNNAASPVIQTFYCNALKDVTCVYI